MSNKNLQCSTKGCTSSTTKIHKFPKDPERCRMWAERAGCLHLLGKGVSTLHTSYGLCADHFHKTSYVMNSKQRLSVYALPEIFPESPGPTNTTDVNASDCETLCRTCACKSNDLVPVFGEKGVQLQLLDKIHTHLPIKVTLEDPLPTAVCSSCIWKLGLCHAFALSCLQADAKLRSVFEVESETEYTNPEDDTIIGQKERDIEDVLTLQDTNYEQTVENNYIYDTGQIELTNNSVYLIDNVKDESTEASTEECIDYDTLSVSDVTNSEFNSVDEQTTILINNEDVNSTVEQEESVKQSVCLNESLDGNGSIVILSNRRKIRHNPKLEVVVEDVEDDSTVTGVSQVPLLSEFRKQQESYQQSKEMSRLRYSDNGLNEHLSNLPMLSTSNVSSNNIKQNQHNSIESNNEIELVNNFTSSNAQTKEKRVKKAIKKNSRSKIVASKKSIRNIISAMQPVVVLERLHFLPVENSGHSKQTVNSKDSDNKVIAQEDGKTDIELREESNVIQTKDKIDPLKIIESIDSIIKRNEEILQKTATKIKEKKVSTPTILPVPPILTKATEHNYFKCLKCPSAFTTEGLLKEHIQYVHPSTFKCSNCNDEFTNFRRYECHMKAHEDEDGYICETCGQFYRYKHTLHSHQYSSHICPKYTCKECCKVFTKRESYEKHVLCHQASSYLCEVCGKSFKYMSNLRSHSKICPYPTRKEQFTCKICDKTYRSRYCFKSHLLVHTNEKPYQCARCGICYRTSGQFRRHTLQHINAQQHKCPVCGKGFNLIQHMRSHAQIHQRKYPCSVCGQTFQYLRELFRHRTNHPLEEIIKANENAKLKRVVQKKPEYLAKCTCQICGKQLSCLNSLKVHLLIHSDEKPFECKICGKAFRSTCQLKTHSYSHIIDKPHACTICEKRFLTNFQLQNHYQAHSQQRFTCRQCNKGYSNKDSLRSHELIHSGIKSYKCEVCQKGFYSRSSLNSHKRVHKEDTFQCMYCDRSFKRKYVLVYHIRTHTGERPYICSVCGRGFGRNGDCKKHEEIHFKKSQTSNATENAGNEAESEQL